MNYDDEEFAKEEQMRDEWREIREHDRLVTLAESDLLRAFVYALDIVERSMREVQR